MVLYNASTKARNATSIVNQTQGGGAKKAGFPYQVGRTSSTSVAFNMTNPVSGHCATATCLNTLRFPLGNQSRPIGGSVSTLYWRR